MSLEKLTGLKLFHNHDTVELALKFFPFGSPAFARLVSDVRRRVMEEVAASDLPGMIFTYVWAFDDPRDRRQVEAWSSIFSSHGRKMLLVELEASQAVRLKRDGTALRLAQKPSKGDRAASLRRLVALDAAHKLNSTDEFAGAERHVRIDNTRPRRPPRSPTLSV